MYNLVHLSHLNAAKGKSWHALVAELKTNECL